MISAMKNLLACRPIGSTVGQIMIAVALIAMGGVGLAGAADSDLSTTMNGPPGAVPGGVAVITVGYTNDGPDTAGSAYVNAYIPSGVPAPIDVVTQLQLDTLLASATADGLGNAPLLFVEDAYCEHLLFQVQQVGGGPMVGLTAGVSGAVTFGLEIPMERPIIGGVIIDQPPSLAREFKAAVQGEHILNAAGWRRYTRGGDCDDPTPGCEDLSLCFGPRVSLIDKIVGEFELVDDGTANPTEGCDPLIGFTPDRIAVIERGSCEFGVKALNAQDAGAVAVFVVNNGTCSTFPASDLCAINMGGGAVGDLVNIPIVQVSLADGQPVITELLGGTTVTGRIGAVSEGLTLDGSVFLLEVVDVDPNADNNESTFDLTFDGIFVDGFESGDTMAWSSVSP